jgi:hypothetical protein
MTTLQEIEAFLKIEIGERRLKDGKKMKDKNQYYYYEAQFYIVKLTQNKWMIVEDCKKTRILLRNHCWSYHNTGYAKTNIIDKSTKFWHQLFLNYEAGLVADHINHKKLDNRNENLRVVTYKDNARNRSQPSSNSSGKQGVSKFTVKGLYYWRVQIKNDAGKREEKCFSITKLGDDQAFELACEYRRQREDVIGYIGD